MSSKINLITRLQHWMDSVPGQTFLNYAYSWGASIVILGALFKLTHLPGGNLMLFAGMGTEVFVFFLSAFDRPFDKTEIGKELPHNYQTDEEIAATLAAQEKGYAPEIEEKETPDVIPSTAQTVVFTAPSGINAPAYVAPAPQAAAPQPQTTPAETTQTPAPSAQPSAPAAQDSLEIPRDADAEQLAAIIRAANDELLHRAQAVLSPEMETATKTYIEKLQTLTDTFQKVDEQSARLTRDSEEMENLNRTLTGINKVYELHLKSISLQVGTIDDINNQTHKLAEQIQRLNSVYARMIDALTVNMVNQSAAAPREQSES
ncbi:gliding motility protein GldL [Alloprevotella tannerae]|uniref:type IX secretion system motor protein PorL/GldL n=1 Tax=Alloprevotella tannerae TaxID=76122 RepID=UPI0028EEB7F7|nr:gliding motility protein GldL [Alloprevotella tannerae]